MDNDFDYQFDPALDNTMSSADSYLGKADHASIGPEVDSIYDLSTNALLPTTYASSSEQPSPPAGSMSSGHHQSGSEHGSNGSVFEYDPVGRMVSLSKSPSSTMPTVQTISDQLIDMYYSMSHASHPFVLPRSLLLNGMVSIPLHLRTVMQFVACHAVPGYPQEALRNAANSIVTDPTIPRDGFKVQSLLLYFITLYARLETDYAIQTFHQAVDLCLELGMHRQHFTSDSTLQNCNTASSPYMVESWRRTFWFLYVVDGLVANLNPQRYSSRLSRIGSTSDVPLPSEDFIYDSLLPLPPTRTVSDLIDRAFADDNYAYSSFAYRIEAMRLSGTVRELGSDPFSSNPGAISAIDASLSSFLLSLPPSKRDLIPRPNRNNTNSVEIDESLFGAHAAIYCAIIALHRPRSNLIFIQNHYPTPCTETPVPSSLPIQAYAVHRSKALHAANLLSNATALAVQPTRHGPCFTCAIAAGAVCHLPAYIMETDVSAAGQLRERLQLAVNALNTMGEVWPLARDMKRQVACFAKEVFKTVAVADSQKILAGKDGGMLRATGEVRQLTLPDFEEMLEGDQWLAQIERLGPLADADSGVTSIGGAVVNVNGV